MKFVDFVGDREVEAKSVAVRKRGQKESQTQKVEEFISQALADIIAKV